MLPPLYVIGIGFLPCCLADLLYKILHHQTKNSSLPCPELYCLAYKQAEDELPCVPYQPSDLQNAANTSESADATQPLIKTAAQWCESLSGCFIISFNNMKLFPAAVVQQNRIINYHNALLPYNRGVNCHYWALWQQDEVLGVTLHHVNEGIDTGSIIAQSYAPRASFPSNLSAFQLLSEQHQQALRLSVPVLYSLLPELSQFCPQSTANDMLEEILQKAHLNQALGSWQSCMGAVDLSSYHWDESALKLHLKRDLPNNNTLDLSWDAPRMLLLLQVMQNSQFLGLPRMSVHFEDEDYSLFQYVWNAEHHQLTLSLRSAAARICKLQLSFGPELKGPAQITLL